MPAVLSRGMNHKLIYIHIIIGMGFPKNYFEQRKIRKIWRYQRASQKPYIEGQTTQWSNFEFFIRITHEQREVTLS